MAKTGPKGPSKFTDKFINNLADEMVNYFYDNQDAWHLVDFAVHKRILRQRFSEFADKNSKFSDALKEIKVICEKRIIDRGYNMRNPAFAIFDLKCNHDWNDKNSLNVTHTGGIDLSLSFNTVPDAE